MPYGFRRFGRISIKKANSGGTGNLEARAESADCMFSDRIASVFPPMTARPAVVDLQYRGRLGWSGGESGKGGKGGIRLIAPGNS